MEQNEVTCNRCERTMQKPTPHNCVSGFTKKRDFRATPPATAAPEASGEAGERWEVRQAREVLAVAKQPKANPSARAGYAGILASCMTGVLQELDSLTLQLHEARQQVAAATKEAEAAGWVPVGERLPEEGGRYWCYVEQQTSLGLSHYQWNCSYSELHGFTERSLSGRVTHWRPLPPAPAQTPPPAAPEAGEAGGEEGGCHV